MIVTEAICVQTTQSPLTLIVLLLSLLMKRACKGTCMIKKMPIKTMFHPQMTDRIQQIIDDLLISLQINKLSNFNVGSNCSTFKRI